MKTKKAVPIVDSLATALRILDHFTSREPELSLRELTEKSGLYKSRVHRLCATLVAMGFLTRLPSSEYRLGPKLLALGKIYESSNTVVAVSRAIMKRLAGETGESVALHRLDGDGSFCLARELGPSRLVFSTQEGDRMDLHASAAGRVLLAWGPGELRRNILDSGTPLKRYTSETMTDPQEIHDRLTVIREQGYDLNRGELETEIGAIAAPVFTIESRVELALAIVGPIQRFSDSHLDEKIDKLLAATREISEILGAA